MKFTLAHSIGNRVRHRTKSTMSRETARIIAEKLTQIPGLNGVTVNPVTGSVLAYWKTREAHQALLTYLQGLETHPIAARRVRAKKKVGLKKETQALAQETEKSFTQAARHIGDLFGRAFSGMPVVEIVRRPFMSTEKIARLQESSDLDFSPLARWVVLRSVLPLLINTANVFLGAVPYFFKGVKNLLHGKLNLEVLDASAIGMSLLLRDFRTAGLVILLLGMGEMLERYTRKKSLASLADQLALKVDRVWVRDGHAVKEKSLLQVKPTDVIVVRTGNTIPVDGTVVAGNAAVNQATMTGEPLAVHREAGGSVFAGTVVEDGEIDIHPTKMGDGTRLNQIVQFIETSEKSKAGIQGKAERLADAVVPFSLTRTDYQGTAYNAGRLWVMGEKLSGIALNDTVRLESGNLTVSLIKLKEAFTSQKLLFSLKAALICGGTPVKTVTLKTSPAGGISIPSQVCSVHMQTDTVDFGQIKATGKAGEVGRRTTALSLVCTAGSDATSTKATVTMKPGIAFEGDTRAIGLTMSDAKTSDNLFVKAFSDSAQTILCTSSEALTPESSTILYDEKTGNVNQRTGLSWLLCRKNSNRLPAGKFTGSATLTIPIE